MSRAITPWAAAILLVLVLAHTALAATSSVVLGVEGMT
jgi:hypothetical protein